jgi:hypothetical protein
VRVLYVRARQALLDALDERVLAEQAAHPGRCVSRADVVREILELGLQRGDGG